MRSADRTIIRNAGLTYFKQTVLHLPSLRPTSSAGKLKKTINDMNVDIKKRKLHSIKYTHIGLSCSMVSMKLGVTTMKEETFTN